MANELVRFTSGLQSNLNNEPIQPGKVLFAINDDGDRSKIFLDTSASTRIPVAGMPYWKDITPLKSKTYTDVIGTANSYAGAAFHFAKVIVPNYTDIWGVTYVIRAKIQNSANGVQYALVHISGVRNTYLDYWVYNVISDTGTRPIYYHEYRPIKQAGLTAGFYPYLGVSMQSTQHPTGASYKRDFEIDLIEATDCQVVFLDNMVLTSSISEMTSTYYENAVQFDATTRGITITGDRNTNYYNRTVLTNNNLIAGTEGIKQYSLIMRDANNNWQSLTTTSGTGTSKAKNTTGFHWNRIYYHSGSSNVAAAAKTANSSVYAVLSDAIDFRYSTNCGSTLTVDQPVYLVGTIGTDNLFYLDDTWWTQTIPTVADGKVYLYVGEAYSTTQIDFIGFDTTQVWYHDGTAFVPYSKSIYAEKDASGNQIDSFYGHSIAVSAHTLSLKDSDGNTLNSVTLPDTTYNAGAGLTLSSGTFAAKLKNGATKSSIIANNITATANRSYYVELDNADKFSVNVPWTDTTYSASDKGIALASGNIFTLSLVSDTAASEAATSAGSATGKYYPVGLDKNNKLVVNVPWSNTTYTAGTGLSLSGNQFSNTGIITLAEGASNGQTKVNGTDTTIVKGLNDLAYIAKDGASSTKFLKGDGTWDIPTDHQYNAGAGLTLTSGTFAVKLKNGTTKSSLTGNTISTTANRQYYVELDSADKLSVNVPWSNTTYSASNKGITLASGNVFTLSLVSDTAASEAAASAGTATGKYYPVGLDSNSKLVVNVPWSNTTYTAGTGLSLSGNQFSNTGIITLAVGTSNGQTKVNGSDITIVKGLNDLAYIAKDGSSSTKYLKGDGTWDTPTNTTYNAGAGLSLSGTTFAAKLQNGATKSTVASNSITTTANRSYFVELDKNDKLSVNVPWSNTTYSASNKGITLASGNVFTLSLVSDTVASEAAASAGTASGKYYPVGLDSNSKLVVNVPWSNTTYTAAAPITLSGNQFTINDGAIANSKLANSNVTVAHQTIALGGEATSQQIGSSPFIVGTQTASTASWKGNAPFASLVDGQQITYWLPYAGTSTSATLQLTLSDGTTTTSALPCYYGGTTRLTTHYGAGSIIHLTYRENVTIGSTTIAAGWWAHADYNTNTNDSAGYIRNWQNNAYMKPTTALYRYEILLSKGDGEHLVPANATSNSTGTAKTTITTEEFNIFEPIYYYSTTSTVAAEANLDGRYYWQMRSDVNLNYSFNIGSTLTASKDVYLVCTLESPTTAKLRNPGLTGADAAVGGSGCISQTLPSTNDGYIYIKLGHAYSTSNIILTLDHPIYFHDGTKLNVYSTGRGIKSISRSGTTFTVTRDDGTTFTFDQKDDNQTYNAGAGLTLSGSTFAAKLKNGATKSSLTGNTISTTSGRQYYVELDSADKLSVNVPWSNTTYSASNKGITLASGNIFTLSLVSDTAASEAAASAGTATGKYYPVGLDSNNKLVVNVPWSNTTYTAGTGLSLSGNQFSNTGIITLAVGTSNGQTKVNGTDTTIVKGLNDLAYIAKDGTSSTKFLKGDGTWDTPADHQYNAGAGLTLSSGTFAVKLKNGATKSSLTGNTISTTASRQYYVELDSADKLSVNVPWTNTTYSASNKGITLASGNIFTLSLVSDTAASEAATSAGTATGKYYPIGLDSNNKLVVNVPWSNTTYTAGTGLSLSGNQFSNTGIVTLAVGTSNGQTKVNGTDTTIVKGLNDLAYIAKDGTSSTKFLKGDGTWDTPTDHQYNAGAGLSLSSGTFSAKLKNGATKSSLTGNTISTTASRQYYVELDSTDKLSVNVPWSNTTYSASNKGITLASGNVFTLSLVSDTAASEAAASAGTATGKYYPVGLDSNSKLVVNVPWSNTTYTAGTGLSLSGNQFSNTGIVTLTVGTSNGQTKVNGTDSTIVKGLNDLAYIAKDGASSTKFLKGDGTWDTPTDHQYNAGAGLTLSGGTFAVKLQNGATKSSLTGNTISTTASRQYYVELDSTDKLSVNVPWSNTTYTASGNGITLSSQQFSLSLKSTTKATYDSETISNTQNKQYAVVMDKSGYLSVNVPWSNTTYTAGVGLTLSSQQFKAKLRSETALSSDSTAASVTTNRIYAVVPDKSGYLSVVVPWEDHNDNTDTKVTQTGNGDSAEYPILLKNTVNVSTETNGVKFNSTAQKQTTINPSTGTISADSYKVANKVQLQYDSTTESLNFVFI